MVKDKKDNDVSDKEKELDEVTLTGKSSVKQ